MKAVDITKEQEIEGFWDIEYEFNGESKIKKNCYGKIKILSDKNIIEFFEKEAIFGSFLIYPSVVIVKKISGVTPQGFCILNNISLVSVLAKNNFVYYTYQFEFALFGDENFFKDEELLKGELSYKIVYPNCYNMLTFEHKDFIRKFIESDKGLSGYCLTDSNLSECSIQIKISFVTEKLIKKHIFPQLEICVNNLNSVDDCIKSIHKVYNLCCFLFNRNPVFFKYITIKLKNQIHHVSLFLRLNKYNFFEKRRLFAIDNCNNFSSYFIGLYCNYKVYADFFDNYVKLITLQDKIHQVVLLAQLVDSVGEKIIIKYFNDDSEDCEILEMTRDIKQLCETKQYDYIIVKNCLENRFSLNKKIKILYKNLARSFELGSVKSVKETIHCFCQIRNKMSHGEFNIAQEIFKQNPEEISKLIDILICGIYIFIIKDEQIDLTEYKAMFYHLYSSEQNIKINPRFLEYCKSVL